jgi:nicotinate-nucleotide--dimethylbenzimidazole phosphoribosyltransferase
VSDTAPQTEPDDATLSRELDRVGRSLPLPDEAAQVAALERQRLLVKPTGALGRLEDLSVWLAGVQGRCPPEPITRPRVVVFAGDHAVARSGVSAYPPEVTAQMVRTIVAGGAGVDVLARLFGASVRVVDMSVDADLSDLPGVSDHKVRPGAGDIAVGPAMTREEAERSVRAGMTVADEEVDAGADLLIAGDVGIGSTTAAATLVALLTDSEVATVVGRGTGIDDRAWMRKCAAVRDAARRGRTRLADMVDLLAEVSGPDIAATSGFLLQAAARRTPVVLDGEVVGAAALVAHRLGYRSRQWWLAGHLSTEPAHARALDRLDLEPVVDFGLRLGEGTGALVALPVLQAAAATLAQMATFDEAGVTARQEVPGPDG